jgi:hypothetical protein
MAKSNEEFNKQLQTGSIGGDEDYLYEQYLMQEKLNEEYWEYVSVMENQKQYIPTPEEEEENYNQTKQNGHT